MLHIESSKSLTDSDIRSKIVLPNRKHMIPLMNGSHFLNLKVMDSRGRKWKLRYYTRPNGRRRSPVFTAGWRRFVKAKRLRVGDKFTFYKDQVRAADGQLKMRYMIEVKRPSMLTFNGEPVTLDVEYLA